MMLDILAAIGLKETGNYVAKEVLLPLLQGSLEDYAKEFFKGCIVDAAGLASQAPVQKALVFDPNLRDVVVTDIHRFTNNYPQVQVVVTSRWLGYKAQTLRDAGFQHYMLQDLKDEQIAEFIQRWHDQTFPEGADKVRKRERLDKAIRESKAIRELAGNPLLLTMMAILNRHQELPRDRPELYNQASRVLLHQWDVERNLIDQRIDPVTIDYADKQAMLRKVADHMQSGPDGLAGNIISAQDLEKILMEHLKLMEVEQPRVVAKLMIKQLRERNFILCFLGADNYAFVHRTFLEYFAAWSFVWKFEKAQTITFEELRDQTFGTYWKAERWHEVLRLISGMIDPYFVEKLIDFLINVEKDEREHKFESLFLAADCLSEARERAVIKSADKRLFAKINDLLVDPETLRKKFAKEILYKGVSSISKAWADNQAILDWLKYLSLSSNAVQIAALQELSRSFRHDPEILLILKTCVQPSATEDIRIVAIQELARGFKDDPETLLTLKSYVQISETEDIRITAIKELARGFRDDPETLKILQTSARSDTHSKIRQLALAELARGFRYDPETLKILKARLQSDENSSVRRVALKELVRGFEDDPETLSLLKDKAKNDVESDVRQLALQELVRAYRDDPNLLRVFKESSESDPDSNVRLLAAREVIRKFKDQLDILSWIRLRAQKDQNWAVRAMLVDQLAMIWENEAELFSWLKFLAQTDSDEYVRRTALRQLKIKARFKNDKNLFCWLKFIAQEHQEWSIRKTALQSLVESWLNEPDAISVFKLSACHDKSWSIRKLAIRSLVNNWKIDPDVFSLIKSKAQSDEDWEVRKVALQELARGWNNCPDVLLVIKSIAQNDYDSDVRQAALQEIVRGFDSDANSLNFWCDRALNDPFEREYDWQDNPRQTALNVLVQQYPDHPKTLELLQDRAQNDNDERLREWAAEQLEQLKMQS